MMQLSQEIFGAWDIGQKGKNNGVLIAVFVNDHKFRIHTGYGMEGILPDLLTKRIQDEDMRPSFKQNNYFEGINSGVDKLIFYSRNGFKAENDDSITASKESQEIGVIMAYVLSIILYFLIALIVVKAYKENRSFKITMLVICALVGMIPALGLFMLAFILVIFSIFTLIRWAVRKSGSWTWSSGGGSYSSGSSWGSSSDSSSSWSSSDSSSDFGGGGGGDSGGGGSSSDW